MQITRRAALVAAAASSVGLARRAAAAAPVEIEMFFPVPVQGKLAVEMQRLIGQFNAQQQGVRVTPVYTGSYDDTNVKTRAAIAAGKPPGAAIMSANFVREYVIARAAIPLDPLIAHDNTTPQAFMQQFWPALRLNATDQGQVYGVPFQNSTPLLYYSVPAFEQAGLDPAHPPATWQEWVDAARKITKPNGERHGIVWPNSYDYCGWLFSTLAMANGGQYYNTSFGGQVYYDDPCTGAALRFVDDLVHRHKVMPSGVLDPNGTTGAFFSGRAGMMLLSTGALSFVREGMKQPFRVAYVPRNILNAAPVGGGSLIIPTGNTPERQEAAWTLIKWLTSPAIAGEWSRFTGYFAPNRAAYDMPEMKQYMAKNPEAGVALEQLNQYGRGWFATYKTVPVRKAMEDQVQAVVNGRAKPDAAAAQAQHDADALLRPYLEQTALKLPA